MTTSPPRSPVRNLFNGARAAASRLENAAANLGSAVAKLENEFVKLGDGIINPEPSPRQQRMEAMRREQQKVREAFIHEQYEIERQIMKRLGRDTQHSQLEQPSARASPPQQHDVDPLSAQIAEESRQQCLEIMRVHLLSFLENNPEGSYEAWVADPVRMSN